MDMTPERWTYLTRYLREVFAREDESLAGIMPRAVKAGLPDIAVSPESGRFLEFMASMAGRDGPAKLALEFGTLAGYSGVWIARGMASDGKLISIEASTTHVAQATETFRLCGLAERVSVRQGRILEVLPKIAQEIGKASVDMVFIDALKSEYPQYVEAVLPLVRSGGVILIDNALASRWTMDLPPGKDADRDTVDALNRKLGADPRLIACCVPIGNGVAMVRKR
ncbi:MAG: O-methyltransferase [Phycisphaeraceae bacterium]|nr:O-methyltransferase [Phycisphaeraceae bacterium]